MATHDVSKAPRLSVDRSPRGGSIGMMLLMALVLVGAAVALLFIGRGRAEPLIALLALYVIVDDFYAA